MSKKFSSLFFLVTFLFISCDEQDVGVSQEESTPSVTQSSDQALVKDFDAHFLILFGQSQMVGHGALEDGVTPDPQTAFEYDADQGFIEMQNPVGLDNDSFGASHGSSYATFMSKYLYRETGKPVYAVICAKGGSTTDYGSDQGNGHWMPRTPDKYGNDLLSLYDLCRFKVLDAMQALKDRFNLEGSVHDLFLNPATQESSRFKTAIIGDIGYSNAVAAYHADSTKEPQYNNRGEPCELNPRSAENYNMEMYHESARIMLRTFKQDFPHAELFMIESGNFSNRECFDNELVNQYLQAARDVQNDLAQELDYVHIAKSNTHLFAAEPSLFLTDFAHFNAFALHLVSEDVVAFYTDYLTTQGYVFSGI